MKRLRLGNFKTHLIVLVVLALLAMPLFGVYVAKSVRAATTADVTVNATPSYVAITDNTTSVDFGIVVASTTENTSTSLIAITNDSTVQTDQTIAVLSSSWSSGGSGWTHSDTATAGANTAGLKSNRGGTWGTGDVIIKYASPNYIYEDCPADQDYAYGLGLQVPTSFTDGYENTITVRVTAAEG